MSFSVGDTVYLCGPNGPEAATFLGNAGADCAIEVSGQRLLVLCSMLHSSPNACPVDVGQLAAGERVALKLVDQTNAVRVWPASVRKTHANGRVQISMDGLSSPQTVDRELLVRL